MTSNFVSQQRLTLTRRDNGGTALTVPDATNSAVVRVTDGAVEFSLDASDPDVSFPNVAYRGQTINLANVRQMRRIINNLRLIPAFGYDIARITAWYFD